MLNEKDQETEEEIKQCIKSDTWFDFVKSGIENVRERNYIMGGLFYLAYTSLPYAEYKEKTNILINDYNISKNYVGQLTRYYRLCREYGHGVSFAIKHGQDLIVSAHQYARGNKTRFKKALAHAKLHGTESVKHASVANGDLTEITHMRFAVTPSQKGYILATLSQFPSRHQGAQLVDLVEAFNRLTIEKVA